MPHRIVQSYLAHDRHLVIARPCQLRRRRDVEHGPASAPILLMMWFPMLEGAKAADERKPRKGKTEGASSEKISIRHLGRGFHFMAGRGLSFPRSAVFSSPSLLIPFLLL